MAFSNVNDVIRHEITILIQENENLSKQVRVYADKVKMHELFIRELADIITAQRIKIKEMDELLLRIKEHLK